MHARKERCVFFCFLILLLCHLQGKTAYLDIIHKYLYLHGTVEKGASIPKYVTNHGIVKGAEVHALLRESKVSESRFLVLQVCRVPGLHLFQLLFALDKFTYTYTLYVQIRNTVQTLKSIPRKPCPK